MKNTPIAHVTQINDLWVTESIESHCLAVAEQASMFAQAFQSQNFAYQIGLVHDLGKYRPAFQQYIKKNSGYDPEASVNSELTTKGKNHASTGAVFLHNNVKVWGKLLAYCVAGHHAGLPDADEGIKAALNNVLYNDKSILEEVLSKQPSVKLLELTSLDTIPNFLEPDNIHLWVRMLFSCLVDADRRVTEAFGNPGQANERQKSTNRITDEHYPVFERYMQLKVSAVQNKTGTVFSARQSILEQALLKAQQPSKIYTMTVPTGGGKTLSSLGFALKHCMAQGKQRIIYAIPFTSIIEQTAAVFRSIFSNPDEDIVLEHHCNLTPETESKQSQLAVDNWDAPIVVTTTVQLFESLLSAKPNACRKLHHLVNSVIVLDEIQALPPEQLNPICHLIQELHEHYGVTFLMTTATPTGWHSSQDALGKGRLKGIKQSLIHEIIDSPEQHYRSLERVNIHMPETLDQLIPLESLAETVSNHDQALVIVNTKKEAQALFKLISSHHSVGIYHLSTLMCPLHRQNTLLTIKQRLADSQRTIVISTQLIEAGVDVDFPIVYRALAGIDSILQAAGRCNREGRLAQKGEVYVFHSKTLDGPLGFGQQATKSRYGLNQNSKDLFELDSLSAYFQDYFSKFNSHDKHEMERLLMNVSAEADIQFRTAGQQFKLIEDNQQSILVDYYINAKQEQTQKALFDRLKQGFIDKSLLRSLQSYTVAVPTYSVKMMLNNNQLLKTDNGFYFLDGGSVYDGAVGLLDEEIPSASVF